MWEVCNSLSFAVPHCKKIRLVITLSPTLSTPSVRWGSVISVSVKSTVLNNVISNQSRAQGR